ncbi:MAG: hypothetical protein LUE98_09855 [Tannerellaceae bacterium]|nr:hypothetical protein [Tannerellaceae bacterium]
MAKHTRFNDLILKLKSIYDCTEDDIAAKIGISRTKLYHCRKGNGKITDNLIDAVCKLDPRINKNWLLTGEGSMLVYVISTDTNGVEDDQNTLFSLVEEGKDVEAIKLLVEQFNDVQEKYELAQDELQKLKLQLSDFQLAYKRRNEEKDK